MRNVFGITPEQAAASLDRYASHPARAGLKDAKLGLRVQHALTRSLTWFATFDAARLLGDAAASPIVDGTGSELQLTAALGFASRF